MVPLPLPCILVNKKKKKWRNNIVFQRLFLNGNNVITYQQHSLVLFEKSKSKSFDKTRISFVVKIEEK
jgi:hypothetical protein